MAGGVDKRSIEEIAFLIRLRSDQQVECYCIINIL